MPLASAILGSMPAATIVVAGGIGDTTQKTVGGTDSVTVQAAGTLSSCRTEF